MRTLLLVLSLAASVYAGKTINLSATGTFTVPSTASGDAVVYYRGYNITFPGTETQAFSMPLGKILLGGVSGRVCMEDTFDSLPSYTGRACVNTTGFTDFTVVWRRSVSALTWGGTVYETNTGVTRAGYCSDPLNVFPCPIGTLNTGNWSGAGTYGNAALVGQTGFIKWATGSPILGVPQKYTTADLANWIFNSNGNDSTGRSNMTLSGAVYTDAPIYPPVAAPRTFGAPTWTTWLSCRAGNNCQMDGTQSYSLGDTAALTYRWWQTAGPSSIQWSSTTASQPTASGMVFGTYSIILEVTDDLGTKGTSTLTFGAVASDSNGVVINSNANFSAVIGDTIRWGANGWSYADSVNKTLADYFGGLQSGIYAPFWRTGALAGTVSVTNGSGTVTGNGTDFTTVCGTGNGIWIRYTDSNEETRYVAYGVESGCTATSMTLSPSGGAVWLAATGTQSELAWGQYTSAQLSYWVNQSTNTNYYDNVMAFYSLYLRSGDSTYLTYARNLADWWIECPFVNRFQEILWANRVNAAPRMRALNGMLLRYIDTGDAAQLQTMRRLWDFDVTQPTTSIGDLREDSYRLAQDALGARFDPDSGRRTTYQNYAQTAVTNRWVANKLSGVGLYSNIWQSNGFGPESKGDTTVTNGSNVVTGTGFQSFYCDNWIAFARSNVFDNMGYRCQFISSTEIRLLDYAEVSTTYQGTSGTSKLYVGNLVGPGVQPYVLGITGWAFWHLYQMNGDTRMPTYGSYITDWLSNYAVISSNGGMYYARQALGCETDNGGGPGAPDSITECVNNEGGSGAVSRDFAGESLAACFGAYEMDPNATTQGICDDVYTVLFGRDGYTLPPGQSNPNNWYYDPSYDISFSRAKYLGYFFGVGSAANWPAARVGGLAPADSRTVTLSYVAPAGASATSATYVAPSGASSTVSCSAGTCALPTDWRQGNYLYRLTHTVTGGTVAGDLEPLKVQ